MSMTVLTVDDSRTMREMLRLALADAGFADIQVYGGYDRSRGVRPSDRVWTFEARRA